MKYIKPLVLSLISIVILLGVSTTEVSAYTAENWQNYLTNGVEDCVGIEEWYGNLDVHSKTPPVSVLRCDVADKADDSMNPMKAFYVFPLRRLMYKNGDGYQFIAYDGQEKAKNVTWWSSNPNVASVDKKGYVTPHIDGFAMIVAQKDNGEYDVSWVIVSPNKGNKFYELISKKALFQTWEANLKIRPCVNERAFYDQTVFDLFEGANIQCEGDLWYQANRIEYIVEAMLRRSKDDPKNKETASFEYKKSDIETEVTDSIEWVTDNLNNAVCGTCAGYQSDLYNLLGFHVFTASYVLSNHSDAIILYEDNGETYFLENYLGAGNFINYFPQFPEPGATIGAYFFVSPNIMDLEVGDHWPFPFIKLESYGQLPQGGVGRDVEYMGERLQYFYRVPLCKKLYEAGILTRETLWDEYSESNYYEYYYNGKNWFDLIQLELITSQIAECHSHAGEHPEVPEWQGRVSIATKNLPLSVGDYEKLKQRTSITGTDLERQMLEEWIYDYWHTVELGAVPLYTIDDDGIITEVHRIDGIELSEYMQHGRNAVSERHTEENRAEYELWAPGLLH